MALRWCTQAEKSTMKKKKLRICVKLMLSIWKQLLVSQAEHSQACFYCAQGESVSCNTAFSRLYSFFSCKGRTALCPKLHSWLLHLKGTFNPTTFTAAFLIYTELIGRERPLATAVQAALGPCPSFSFCLGPETHTWCYFKPYFSLRLQFESVAHYKPNSKLY